MCGTKIIDTFGIQALINCRGIWLVGECCFPCGVLDLIEVCSLQVKLCPFPSFFSVLLLLPPLPPVL